MTRTILVVDDQEDERDALAGLLRRHHYLVESAANGRDALERLRRGAPQLALVLLDLNMPVMDGWELLYHVAQDRSLRRIPVIVISGSPIVPDAIVVPANVTFVSKPVRPVAIVKVIADMLQQAARAETPTASEAAAAAIDDTRDVSSGPCDGGAVYWSPAMIP